MDRMSTSAFALPHSMFLFCSSKFRGLFACYLDVVVANFLDYKASLYTAIFIPSSISHYLLYLRYILEFCSGCYLIVTYLLASVDRDGDCHAL